MLEHDPMAFRSRLTLAPFCLVAGVLLASCSDRASSAGGTGPACATPDRAVMTQGDKAPAPTGGLSAPGSAGGSAPANSTYVIGAGDTLSISVYRAPELSVPSIPVRPDGRISMPLIPEIVAAGKTPTELGKELEAKIKEYVQEPIVTVMVSSFVGPFERQVKVLGEATEPVAIPYRDGMTVLDVMIATKGLTKYAAGNNAVIVRKVGGQQESVAVRLNDLLKNGDICQNVEMRPGDTLIIPQSWL
jgi:polysaccharide export outer membrane protein